MHRLRTAFLSSASILRCTGGAGGASAPSFAVFELRALYSDAAAQHSARKKKSLSIPGVKHIVAVASGKGGVGKSTVATNLAVALSNIKNESGANLKVGILDADVYGPSIPTMLNLSGYPEVTEQKKMVPLENLNLKSMSIGYFADPKKAFIWRGPMVMSVLEQMMREVEWGNLDVLLIDLPPGTGDAQLTITQRVTLAGAVVVSTPQNVALADARRGVAMFEKVKVPILGLVENMSYYLCRKCGAEDEIFGRGGVKQEAAELNVPFLGEIPLHGRVREQGDAGTPIVAAYPDDPVSKAFDGLAGTVWAALNSGAGGGVEIEM
eukprot:CAMPEP_0113897392 /NCGR_PEP_ID=MMETSP0780_2-20120614/18641_1 /TAXON_ID=652834 /ORGANISM="Palpitomonas bilix" /LENGTH=322 /DNA_ID=CAMNT_0000888825 /DNA_START=300 /DNA_END=1268 /DNA_ORIENTATION=+ /assembly_acc=CAM_ASM_000599